MTEKDSGQDTPFEEEVQKKGHGHFEHKNQKNHKNHHKHKAVSKDLDRDFKIKPVKKKEINSDLLRLLIVALSALLYVISLRFFTDVSGLLPGGFAGLSKLIQRISLSLFGVEVPFAILNIGFNLIPALIAYKYVGKKFVIFSVIHVLLSSFLMDIIPINPVVDDIFLNTIFGALLSGFSLVMALQVNASAGGIDFISMTISNLYNRSVWNELLIFNAIILAISGFMFGFEAAMYSVIFQMISTIIVNKMHTRFQKRTIWIVTKNAEPLATDLMKLTGHGITSFDGIGRYSGEKRTLLYMVVSKDDVIKIRKYISSIGEPVFMNVSESEDIDGRFHLEPFD